MDKENRINNWRFNSISGLQRPIERIRKEAIETVKTSKLWDRDVLDYKRRVGFSISYNRHVDRFARVERLISAKFETVVSNDVFR